MNKELTKYNINLHGLEDKDHKYSFEGDDSFFEEFEQEIIEGGTFKIDVLLEKNTTFVRLNLDIESNLRLICDRSLEEYTEVFHTKRKYIFKYGNKNEEYDDEIEVITYGTPKINIATLIFEYILLQVPMKKLHPRFRDEEGEEGTMVYIDPKSKSENEEETQDPRWAALINLKNNNN